MMIPQRMIVSLYISMLWLWLWLPMRTVVADLVLSKQIITLAIASAELSSVVQLAVPIQKVESLGFELQDYYESPESGKAIVAKKNGYCFVNYCGSSLTWTDWDAQDFGREKICLGGVDSSNATLGDCCSTRIGFAKAYNSTSRDEIEKTVRECAKSCNNPDECVVFGGHSEGGAIAAIAALEMAHLNPYIMTFGQPSTIDAPCPMLSGERLFRFVNTKMSTQYGITYDPVPFIQGLGADTFGYMIFLGDDSTRVASIGVGARTADFRPDVPFGLQAHSMLKSHAIPGYLDRLRSLLKSDSGFPILCNGFVDGSFCNEDLECRSGQCQLDTRQEGNLTTCVPIECAFNGHCRRSDTCVDGVCVPKLQSCMPCGKDEECSSGECLSGLCTGSSGLLDNNCNCKFDSECATHRCRQGVCEAGLPRGASCASPEDCSSGVCGSTVVASEDPNTHLWCQDSAKIGTAAMDIEMSKQSSRRCRLSWGGMLVVMLFCMIITFTIVKGFLHCRRKDYTYVPSAENYS